MWKCDCVQYAIRTKVFSEVIRECVAIQSVWHDTEIQFRSHDHIIEYNNEWTFFIATIVSLIRFISFGLWFIPSPSPNASRVCVEYGPTHWCAVCVAVAVVLCRLYLLNHERCQGPLCICRNRVNALYRRAFARTHQIAANYHYCPECVPR